MRDVPDRGLAAGLRREIVRPREDDDDFRVAPIELAVLEAPQDVLRLVAGPAEVGGASAEEILFPVCEKLGIVGRSPAPHDRVADEIDVDAAFGRFRDELLVDGLRDGIRARSRQVGWFRRLCAERGCAGQHQDGHRANAVRLMAQT